MKAILNLTKQMTWCEFAGSLFGLIGAFVLARQDQGSEAGFIFFLISNLFFIHFSITNRYFALLAMQIGFTATSLMGIYNGFIL
ncbi:MAG: nicotinamide mononucleotide transporter [Pseudomonadota bacterium]|jgi:nicotinamide riboside transporter PnuC|uniref:Uncharacterized protein n=1 Tax=Methylophaga aminisulfidivorans MP TaxID=1026882 RepID=F5T134_9GAMM|nr:MULTISPECIES: nicotinamide mononucleotide transporter [Methylophaga]MEC9412590.1 nicotinamide mononucleotide transporter [Pseudomonadota bacterium]EGL53930.1 hypothetical protein MAMP_00272 [Methylophaga aminisulfidivorans MP]WVI83694.1 nicotinamide mononucleotide transporter [Methylophaga thalassica]HIC45336.1 hypothetical protein [Methylophaga sp.]HIM41024.1 hypothetical protein [Methylophaga aminisulfidivorans]